MVFGRDECGSEFVFTQKQIDMGIRRWSGIVRAVGVGRTSKPSPELIQAVELCVSDSNKPLLLNNVSFLPYLVDALLLVRMQYRLITLRESWYELREHHFKSAFH